MPGQDTDRDVLATLGPPARLTRLAEGYAFLYEGGDLDARSVGASIYQFRSAYAWSKRSFQIAAFVFDPEGTLIGAAIERSDAGTGRGFSIGTRSATAADQFVFLLPASQHFWGRRMLRRAPQLLTEQTNLSSGEAGVERRGTTTKVGQNTLTSGYITALALLELLRTETGQ